MRSQRRTPPDRGAEGKRSLSNAARRSGVSLLRRHDVNTLIVGHFDRCSAHIEFPPPAELPPARRPVWGSMWPEL